MSRSKLRQLSYVKADLELLSQSQGRDSVSGMHPLKMVGRARFELATNGLKVRCSTD